MAICMPSNRAVSFHLMCWIWLSWNVHRIDMRLWLLILWPWWAYFVSHIDVNWFSAVVVDFFFLSLSTLFSLFSSRSLLPCSLRSILFSIQFNSIRFSLGYFHLEPVHSPSLVKYTSIALSPAMKVNKVSFLLAFLTTTINNSFSFYVKIFALIVADRGTGGLHQFSFNVNYE